MENGNVVYNGRPLTTLDVNAKAYAEVASLFTVKAEYTLWRLLEKDGLIQGALGSDVQKINPIQISLADFFSLCPDFFMYHYKKLKVSGENWIALPSKPIWDQCINQDVFVGSTQLSATFITEVLAISAVDEKNELLTGQVNGYTLLFRKIADDLITELITSGFKREDFEKMGGCALETSIVYTTTLENDNAALIAFERKYPGFTKKAMVALSVGLTGKEAALHAVGKNQNQTNETFNATLDVPNF